MRIYALLFGIALTTAYGAAAQLAVSSLDTGHHAGGNPAAAVPASAGPGDVWYGGVLDPITVESSGGNSRAPAHARILTRPTVRCVGADRSTFRTIS
jgi:hypothetical protein